MGRLTNPVSGGGGGTTDQTARDAAAAAQADATTALGRAKSSVTSSISANTTAASAAQTNYTYLVSGTTTLTLPTAVGAGRYNVKNTGTNLVTIATTSSQTIDGSQPIVVSPNESLDIISDGTNWRIV